jgi:hypothetical protein
VVVVVSGRPLILGDALSQADAVVAAWLPGTEGQGVADVLFGDYKPTGKLSFTWPRTMAQIPINVGTRPTTRSSRSATALRTDRGLHGTTLNASGMSGRTPVAVCRRPPASASGSNHASRERMRTTSPTTMRTGDVRAASRDGGGERPQRRHHRSLTPRRARRDGGGGRVFRTAMRGERGRDAWQRRETHEHDDRYRLRPRARGTAPLLRAPRRRR